MIRLRGLDDSEIVVKKSSIYRLRPNADEKDEQISSVEYNGGYIFTREHLSALMARLKPDISFVQLATRRGDPVWLNPAQVSRVREALPINAPGSEITIAGRYQHVIDPIDEVTEKLGISVA